MAHKLYMLCQALISPIRPTGPILAGLAVRRHGTRIQHIDPSAFSLLREGDLLRLTDKAYRMLDTAHPAPGMLERYYALRHELDSRHPAAR